MVDISVGLIPPVQNNRQSSGNQQQPLPFKNRQKGRERRKNKLDRRQDVRDGFVVTLSTLSDRRRRPDRRKNQR